VEGSCEHGNKPSSSTKYWEIFEQLSDWQLLKKDAAAWNQLFSVDISISDHIASNSRVIHKL
jgi:hypothetical protein